MKFKAELKEVKQTKVASLDNVYSVRLVTDDCEVLDLGKLPPDTVLDVEIEAENESEKAKH